MPQKRWALDPGRGGIPIPETVKQRIETRIRKYAEQHFAGRYTRLDIYFKKQFCYIDAYTEPVLTPGWPPEDGSENRDEYAERLRNTPTHLCRLRFFAEDRWGFAFYTYSNEKYELSRYPSGDFFGTPEEAFEVSAGVYLE